MVWDNCTQHDSLHLQSLFNYACCLSLLRPRLSSSSALWKELGLTLLHCCRRLHLVELTYKCLNSLAPPYLSSLFRLPTHHHNTRRRNLINLLAVRMTFGQHAVSYRGASLWRSLPASLRDSRSLKNSQELHTIILTHSHDPFLLYLLNLNDSYLFESQNSYVFVLLYYCILQGAKNSIRSHWLKAFPL